MKKVQLYFIYALVAFICFYIFIVRILSKKQAEDYRTFDSSVVKGRISSSSPSQGEQKFAIGHSKQMYRFKEILTPANDRDFGVLAERGDSVYKGRYADTIYLYKKDGSAKYRFAIQKVQ